MFCFWPISPDSIESAKREIGFFFPDFCVDEWMEKEEPEFRAGHIQFDHQKQIHTLSAQSWPQSCCYSHWTTTTLSGQRHRQKGSAAVFFILFFYPLLIEKLPHFVLHCWPQILKAPVCSTHVCAVQFSFPAVCLSLKQLSLCVLVYFIVILENTND